MPFTSAEFKVSTADGRLFTLLEPVYYIRPSTGETIVIPSGATSDGASTPREIWGILPPFGLYWRAAFLHDYLYRNTGRNKSDCDLIFKEAMIECLVPILIATAMYEAVSRGGEWSFDDDRKRLIEQHTIYG